MKLRMYTLLAIFVATPLLRAHAQTWFQISPESTSVSVTLPAGTTYRFGNLQDNLWSPSVTVAVATTFSPVDWTNGVFPFADPDPGVLKEFDVLEGAAAQMISVTNLAVNPATTLSLAVPPLVAPASIPVAPGTAYTLTFSNLGISSPTTNSSVLNYLTVPTSGASVGIAGTQMNITIDGVTLFCTVGGALPTGTFTLNCAVPAAPKP